LLVDETTPGPRALPELPSLSIIQWAIQVYPTECWTSLTPEHSPAAELPPNDALESSDNSLSNRRCSDDDSTGHALVFLDAMALDSESCRHGHFHSLPPLFVQRKAQPRARLAFQLPPRVALPVDLSDMSISSTSHGVGPSRPCFQQAA
jgi:hypothetical protein